jgi:hypothetical protein
MRRLVLFLLPGLGIAPLAIGQGYEAPGTAKASALLEAKLLQGPHHKVAEEVDGSGYFYGFKIVSDYGEFEAIGRSLLLGRLREVEALTQLSEVSKSEVFLKAAGGSVLNVGKGAANAVTNPGETAKGVGAGVKRMGMNLGRKAKRGADSAADAVAGDEEKPPSGEPQKSTGDKAEDGATSAIAGKSIRRWAQKLGVDPYTTNPVMRQALADIGKIDAAGGIAAKVVVPIPMVVSTTASVNNLVWGKDPEELRKLNEQRLLGLGVAKPVAEAFFKNKLFSPSGQTRLIAALSAVKAKGCEDYVDAAREAQREREALFFVESAEMLQAFHAESPVSQILTDSRAMVAKSAGGSVAVLVPVDQIHWTEPLAKAVVEIDQRARGELGATSIALRIPGAVSERARSEMKARVWEIRELPAPGARSAR